MLMLSRRNLLLGLAVAGCGRALVDDLPSEDITGRPVSAPNVLKIVIFEFNEVDLLFHTGLIIQTPQTRMIFDPMGAWESDECRRDGELIRNVTSEAEAQYLERVGLAPQNIGWTVHLFETPVSAAVATRAMALAEERPPPLPLHCAKEVSTVLSNLPGFDFVEPDVLTADLYRTLRARSEFSYTRRFIN